ncbi:MAG: (Fe-S)-binding protein [Gaiellaceae bacterium]
MTETRETFAGLSGWQIGLWYALVAVSTAIFVIGVVLLVRKYRRGRGGVRFDRPAQRIVRAGWIVLTHAWIKRRVGVVGLAHAFVFYGFVVLFIGTAIIAFEERITEPVFGWTFWEGWFYLGYSLFLDVFGALLLAGLVILGVVRGVVRPRRLDYGRPDRDGSAAGRERYVIGDWVFLLTLAFVGATGFLLEAFRIAETNPSFEKWAPLGWLMGQGLIELGMSPDAAGDARFAQWWVHGIAALAFVSAIPFTKAVHMLTGPASVATRNDAAGRRLEPLPADASADEVGYGRILDLSPTHLLQLDACTKCGKCTDACPAAATGYPLSPRDLILDLREHAEGALGIRNVLHVPPLALAGATIAPDPVRPEALWSCMQCMACVEICPVGIEHVPIINQLRRRLVDRGEMDPLLQSTLEAIHESGNSFGEPKRKRGRWVKELEFEVKDARKEPVELLWFVGDYASLDPRNQRVSKALARTLHHAGVDFGVLYEAERNAGNDVRRVGEEWLFTDLAESNIETLSSCEFERILTSDPHSFNTIRNEYPTLGGSWEVVHHSQLLLELVESGAIASAQPLGYRVTYHDPCHLGRYNGVYDAPRQMLAAIGCELVEMPRNRDSSFCCGAGGGRIWMEELKQGDAPRPNESRIHEAVALGGIDYFVTACPKDVTMYEDAIRTSGHQGEIELREISELVLEWLDLVAVPAGGAPEAPGTSVSDADRPRDQKEGQ